MSEIASGDLHKLQTHLQQLYAQSNSACVGRLAARIAHQLIAGDIAKYCEIGRVHPAVKVMIEPETEEQRLLDRLDHFQSYLHQHPVLGHFRRHPHDEPRKISDFLADTDFQQLELYRAFYGPLGINYQMATLVAATDSCDIVITINRRTSDFTERERQLLALLQPHIRQAYENATTANQSRSKLARAHSMLDRLEHGVLFVDAELKVLQTTAEGARFLADQCEDGQNSAYLPDSMAAWARTQIAASLPHSETHASRRPMTIPTKRGFVTARLEPAEEVTVFAITLRSGPQPSQSDPFGMIGLTRRQSEILLQLTQGKRNEQIARDLGISVRTVHKHLEHIYNKIRVSNRSEAISRALEWMR